MNLAPISPCKGLPALHNENRSPHAGWPTLRPISNPSSLHPFTSFYLFLHSRSQQETFHLCPVWSLNNFPPSFWPSRPGWSQSHSCHTVPTHLPMPESHFSCALLKTNRFANRFAKHPFHFLQFNSIRILHTMKNKFVHLCVCASVSVCCGGWRLWLTCGIGMCCGMWLKR